MFGQLKLFTFVIQCKFFKMTQTTKTIENKYNKWSKCEDGGCKIIKMTQTTKIMLPDSNKTSIKKCGTIRDVSSTIIGSGID